MTHATNANDMSDTIQLNGRRKLPTNNPTKRKPNITNGAALNRKAWDVVDGMAYVINNASVIPNAKPTEMTKFTIIFITDLALLCIKSQRLENDICLAF
jgi:hypothetical protein